MEEATKFLLATRPKFVQGKNRKLYANETLYTLMGLRGQEDLCLKVLQEQASHVKPGWHREHPRGKTLLTLALWSAHYKVAAQMVDLYPAHTLGLDIRDEFGKTVMDYAALLAPHWINLKLATAFSTSGITMNNQDAINLMRRAAHNRAYAGNEKLHVFMIWQDVLKYDVNLVNEHGSVLHEAAASGCQEVMLYLLNETNVNPGLLDKNQKTALHHCFTEGYPTQSQKIVAIQLIQHGCPRDQADDCGLTALDYLHIWQRLWPMEAYLSMQHCLSF